MRYTRNDRRESRNAIYGEVNGIVPSGNFLFRTNDGVTYDHVYIDDAAHAARRARRVAALSRSRTSDSTKASSIPRRSGSRRPWSASSAARAIFRTSTSISSRPRREPRRQ